MTHGNMYRTHSNGPKLTHLIQFLFTFIYDFPFFIPTIAVSFSIPKIQVVADLFLPSLLSQSLTSLTVYTYTNIYVFAWKSELYGTLIMGMSESWKNADREVRRNNSSMEKSVWISNLQKLFLFILLFVGDFNKKWEKIVSFLYIFVRFKKFRMFTLKRFLYNKRLKFLRLRSNYHVIIM